MIMMIIVITELHARRMLERMQRRLRWIDVVADVAGCVHMQSHTQTDTDKDTYK